jgi:hypothetical protein
VKAKEIFFEEMLGIERFGEFVSLGMPFGKGELQDTETLILLNENGEAQDLQVKTLNTWSDGSVKWALLDFQVSLAAPQRSVWQLKSSEDRGERTHGGKDSQTFRVSTGTDFWIIDTGKCRFHVDAGCFRPFSRVQVADSEILAPFCSEISICDEKGDVHVAEIDSMGAESTGPIRFTLVVRGHFRSIPKNSVVFFGRLHFYKRTSLVRMELTIRNPRPVRHPGGLWDLGDAASLFFRELGMSIHMMPGTGNRWDCVAEKSNPPINGRIDETVLIYQESSGGENWRNYNHRNRKGIVPLSLKGYEVVVNQQRVASGYRAEPIIWTGSGESGVGVYVPYFWQNFPKSIETSKDQTRIGFFPGRFPDVHELQGGEQKTHTVFLDFHVHPSGLDWARLPLRPVAESDVFRSSGALPDLPGADDLVDRFLPGAENLLARRESIDEYGWRNYGDIYADHEAIFHNGPEPLISHYNNQYDVIAGAYRKYMATGNLDWFCLASDLAWHVNDIDIYHTDKDREEYNNGFFWHTDHYKSAGLSTHRSFSREFPDIKGPKSSGGGPAAEHCYTTGLALHYFLTGESEFRQTVLNAADWCLRSLNGPQTILAALRKGKGYLTRLRTKGNSRRAFPHYPLSRGTGNTLGACLDAFDVGGGRYYMDQVEEIIRGTVHPDDDIEARDLLNPEMSWSYTVVLVAIARYLDKKQEMGELNQAYEYARRCLLAYAEWMIGNEYPYLNKPELLEYPTETWAAQELRKSVILYNAAKYAVPSQREALRKKGLLLYEAAVEELNRHPTSSFTRPLALMLQNGWVGARLRDEIPSDQIHAVSGSRFGNPTPTLCVQSVVARFVEELARSLKRTSMKREFAWIKARITSRPNSPNRSKWNQ